MNKEWMSPCGLYCGVCGIMIADRDNNEKFKQKLSGVYNLPAEQIKCSGCLAPEEEVFFYCRVCPIKTCATERGYEGCHQCDDWPCDAVDKFPMPVGRKVIMRAVPQRREWGDEKFANEEEKRYRCPSCDHALFRGAKRCNACGETVDAD